MVEIKSAFPDSKKNFFDVTRTNNVRDRSPGQRVPRTFDSGHNILVRRLFFLQQAFIGTERKTVDTICDIMS